MRFATSTLLAIVLGAAVLVAPVAGQEKPKEKPQANAPPKVEKSIFPDKNLETVVRREVFEKRYNVAPITAADVEKISRVVVRDIPKTLLTGKIKDLSGLEHCKSVMEIDLKGQEITDLSPLADLTRIQSLDLADNKISDIKPLAKLKNLQYLELSNNQVTSLEPLAGLTASTRNLYLAGNRIEDVGPLAGMSKLVSLYLADNRVRDIRPLAKLQDLERLELAGNQVADLTALEGLTDLKFLFLQDNQIKDLSPLVRMAKADAAGEGRFVPFWKVYLTGNPLSEEAKAQMEELKKLGTKIETWNRHAKAQ